MTDLVNPFAVELRSMIEDDDPFAAAGKRGRYKRPLVTTPDGEEVEYQRPSSIAKTLDDSGGLLRWGAGMAALGVAEDPELAGFLRSVDTSLPGWKKVIYDYGDRAKESASVNTGSDYGSLIHQLCAHRELGTTPTFDIPAGVAGAVDAYMDEKERLGIETVVVEFTIVNDRLRFAGTVDRLYRLPSGELVIGDLKTNNGRQEVSWAIQCAIYATADAIYEPATGERKPLPEGWSKEKAIVAHISYAERDDEDDCTFGIVPIGGGS